MTQRAPFPYFGDNPVGKCFEKADMHGVGRQRETRLVVPGRAPEKGAWGRVLRPMRRLLLLLMLCAACATSRSPFPVHEPNKPSVAFARRRARAAVEDANLWLEEVTGEQPLAWVKTQNQRSTSEPTADPRFAKLKDRLLSIYSSKYLPWVAKRNKGTFTISGGTMCTCAGCGGASPGEYKKPQPAWETVLDLDALATAEHENWVWHGANCLYPKYERCLVSLSRGGADATVVREFDVVNKAFVDGGFALPEAKSRVGWKMPQHALRRHRFRSWGPHRFRATRARSRSGRAGSNLAEAKLLFEGEQRTWTFRPTAVGTTATCMTWSPATSPSTRASLRQLAMRW